MKRSGKKLAVMIMMAVVILSMAVPAHAKMIITTGFGYGKEDTTYCTTVRTTGIKKTLVLKQTKGTLIYKKVNGSTTTRSSYAEFRVVIRENGQNGKIVLNKVWSSGTLKWKGRVNKQYYVELEYVKPVGWEVIFGPMYRQDWKKEARWTVKAAWF